MVSLYGPRLPSFGLGFVKMQYRVKHLLIFTSTIAFLLATFLFWKQSQVDRFLETKLVDLKLSNRAIGVLLPAKIFTLEALAQLEETDLYNLPNCGETTIVECRQKLQSFGLYQGIDEQEMRNNIAKYLHSQDNCP